MKVNDSTIKFYLTVSVLVSWLIGIYVVINFNIVTKGQNPWNKPTPKYFKNPGPLWCERRRPMDFMAEPSNATSNFAYILVGLIMIHIGIYDHLYNQDPDKHKKSLMIQHPAFSYSYGFSACLLGVCSFLWHASNLKPHDHWDVQSMHSVVIFPIFYFLFQLIHWIPKSGDLLLVLHFGLKYYMFLFGLPFGIRSRTAMLYILIGLVVTGTVTFLFKFSTRIFKLQWFLMGVLMFVVGYGFWNLEKQPGWCFPDSLIQFHGLWHVFTAIAMLSCFWYLRSDVIRENVINKSKIIPVPTSQGADLLVEQLEYLMDLIENHQSESE